MFSTRFIQFDIFLNIFSPKEVQISEKNPTINSYAYVIIFASHHIVSLYSINIGFNFDKHRSLSDNISSLSKSCYFHVSKLRCIRLYLDNKTASTVTTCTVHSKNDYCNSLYYYLPTSQLDYLQLIQNSLAEAPKSSLISPIHKPIDWLKINEHVKYKLLFPTIKFSQPLNLLNTRSQTTPQNYINIPSSDVAYSSIINLGFCLLYVVYLVFFYYFTCFTILPVTAFIDHVHLLHVILIKVES